MFEFFNGFSASMVLNLIVVLFFFGVLNLYFFSEYSRAELRQDVDSQKKNKRRFFVTIFIVIIYIIGVKVYFESNVKNILTKYNSSGNYNVVCGFIDNNDTHSDIVVFNKTNSSYLPITKVFLYKNQTYSIGNCDYEKISENIKMTKQALKLADKCSNLCNKRENYSKKFAFEDCYLNCEFKILNKGKK